MPLHMRCRQWPHNAFHLAAHLVHLPVVPRVRASAPSRLQLTSGQLPHFFVLPRGARCLDRRHRGGHRRAEAAKVLQETQEKAHEQQVADAEKLAASEKAAQMLMEAGVAKMWRTG